ncbi:copper resistance CopC family protein [Actinotalea sp. Marseille-Q4924]|uniref:copper resistance CopC family protein n=1 Tax=Actinotalea sp. Marseille-Q4924 TaxID=2866571 RepID=UPI001CE47C4E|nr:copper resistance CopC family protein [Actinotalea sp. Marseille-Q4924]
MPDHPLSAPVRPAAAGLVTAVLLTVWSLLAAAPAAAHDRLLSSDPADGAVLDAGPAAVVLTFSSDQLPVGAAVVVRDAAGTDRTDGTPTVSGPTVTQTLQPLPAGAYAVQWRSVSADGHPIEGAFAFEVTGGAGGDEPVAPAAPTEEPGAQGTDDDPPAAEEAAAVPAEATGGEGTAWRGPVVAVAGVVALGAALAVAVRRSRRDEVAP